jgi:hypothetical protein
LVTTDALWVDLLNPTSAEVASVEEAIGDSMEFSIGLRAQLKAKSVG